MLRIQVGLAFSHKQTCYAFGDCVGTTLSTLTAHATYGVTDGLEVGAVVLPLLLTPVFGYSGPAVFGTYRFLRGNTELGVSAAVNLPIDAPFGVTVGTPLWLRFLPHVLLQTGAFLDGFDAGDIGLGLRVPFSALFQLTSSLWAGVDTGFSFQFTGPGPGETLTIPVGVEAGYAIPGSTGKPIADVLAGFGFPDFLTPGAPDVVNTSFWAILVAGRVYVDL
jgi:hypothetical protein